MNHRRLVLAIPALLVAQGLLARELAARAFTAFVRYETPFTFPRAVPAEPPAVALSPHVVLVLLDGLGLEPSRGLPFLDELRARGADFSCRIGLPSLSLPGRAVILSGAWADVHGQSSNDNARPLAVEHVFAGARGRGLDTALTAYAKTQTLLAPHVARAVLLPEAPETAPFATYEAGVAAAEDAARRVLAQARSGLAMFELYVVDETGHGWGGASDEYRRATRLADDAVRRLAIGLDLSRETLVVTADHGHVPAGGHGGPEPAVMTVPLVMAGAGIRAGARGECLQVDVAPTLSALLGLPLPSANRGRPLMEALTLGDAARMAWLRSTVEQRVLFSARYRAWLAGGDSAPSPVPVIIDDEEALWQTLEDTERDLAAAGQARRAVERRARLPWALLMAAAPMAVLGLLAVKRVVALPELARAAAAAAAGVALYHALLPAFGLRYSLTAVNRDERLEPFFRTDMVLGLAAALLAVTVALLWSRRRGVERGDLVRVAWLTAAAVASLFTVKVAFAFWREAVLARWRLPDMWWAFGFYLDVLVLMAVGFAGPLFALLAWPVARLAAPTAASPPR